MSQGSSNAREISLGNDFGAVTVRVNGATIDVGADGVVRVNAPANDTATKVNTAPEIGDEMEDGTIYAGISPDTHKPMYARLSDESGTYTFNEAAKHAKDVGDGFHVPTKNELNVLYENRNKGRLAGTFDVSGSYPAGWYWSSKPYFHDKAWAQRFSNGFQDDHGRHYGSSLRLVR
jgi:hypothetical protein